MTTAEAIAAANLRMASLKEHPNWQIERLWEPSYSIDLSVTESSVVAEEAPPR